MTYEIPKKIHYLYKIINKINNKIYIGQSISPNSRWNSHCRSSHNPKVPIQFALNKYGIDNFEFTTIASCVNQDDANYIETELIKQYDCFVKNNKGYNATYGGMNSPKSDEFKQKMKNYWSNPIYKKQVSNAISYAFSNRTIEEKEKTSKLLSEKLSGKHLSTETEFKIGHKLSQESLEKMIKNKIGKLPWNKGTIGVMKPPPNGFKKGHIPKTKGTHITNSGSFTAGHIPWSKGKKYKKEKINYGENTSSAKLNSTQVLEILSLYNEFNMTKTRISKIFNVSHTAISKILLGKTWSHITNIKQFNLDV